MVVEGLAKFFLFFIFSREMMYRGGERGRLRECDSVEDDSKGE